MVADYTQMVADFFGLYPRDSALDLRKSALK